MVQRTRTTPTTLAGNNVVQGGVTIGTFQQQSGWTNTMPMRQWRKLTAVFPNGQIAAQAYYEQIIPRNQQTYLLTLPNGSSQTIVLQIAEELRLDNSFINYLVKNNLF